MADLFTNREIYIKSIFCPTQKSEKKNYLSEEEADKIVKSISSIGERYGFIGDEKSKNTSKSSKRKHKYDVWIAKEIKKNLCLIEQFDKIRFILDWAIQTKCNIFLYSFEEAFELQDKWHKSLFEKYEIKKIDISDLDEKRVIYRCSDKIHFFYLLTSDDLEYEGHFMNMCVGSDNYKSKVRNNRSIIFSLRDNKNDPHMTTEIDVQSNSIIQQYGKGNTEPKMKYKRMLIEFVLFATNYCEIENKEIINLLNLNITL